MYEGVPFAPPPPPIVDCVAAVFSDSLFESPKSVTLHRRREPSRRTFSVLRSRCSTPLEYKYAMPSATSESQRRRCASSTAVA